jgi:hypothetical protein
MKIRVLRRLRELGEVEFQCLRLRPGEHCERIGSSCFDRIFSGYHGVVGVSYNGTSTLTAMIRIIS